MRSAIVAFIAMLLCGVIGTTALAQGNNEEATLSKLQSDFFLLEEKIGTLIGQQEELQYRLQLLQEEVAQLSQNSPNTTNGGTASVANEDLLQRLQSLEADIAEVRSSLATASSSAQSAVSQEGTAESSADDVAQSPPEDSSSENANAVDENAIQAAYRDAFSQLTLRQYEAAEVAFKDFIENHGTHPLAANAVYWLGESYYVRGDYRTAAQQFLTSYNDYPKGGKRYDSLLKLALSLKALQVNEQACVALGELLAVANSQGGEGLVSENIRLRTEREREELQCA